MSDFFSKKNLLFIYDIFKEYIQDSFGIQLEVISNVNDIKKQIFQIMSDIHNDPKNKNVKFSDKNIAVLTKTKQYYTKHLQIQEKSENKKPNIQNLSRDKDIYGNRKVVVADKRPSADPYMRKGNVMNTDRNILQMYEESRDEEIGIKKNIPDNRLIAPLDKDQPVSEEEFFKKIQELEENRYISKPLTMEILDNRMQVDIERIELNNIDKQDPKQIYNNIMTEYDNNYTLDNDVIMDNRTDIIIPRTKLQKKKLEKYITINSFDRNWISDVMRYKYTVSFHSSLNDADTMNKYKDIHSICVSKVVIPEEVFSTNSILHQVKQVFNYEFSFSYPYLLLLIDEFQDVYDGTNQSLRKAFATLVYNKHYKAPNGRGYVILKPVQKEKKEFFPMPLVNLSRMSLQIVKPNGELLNDSADNYKIFKIEYEVFNPQFLKIVTNMYFDKNEFYTGDVINIQDFSIEIDINIQDERELMDFMNRNSGHEVREIGAANDNGFFRSFYIQAPGNFDKTQGKFNVSRNLIDILNSYNESINWMIQENTNGYILNSSLQNSISLTLEVLIDDASIII